MATGRPPTHGPGLVSLPGPSHMAVSWARAGALRCECPFLSSLGTEILIGFLLLREIGFITVTQSLQIWRPSSLFVVERPTNQCPRGQREPMGSDLGWRGDFRASRKGQQLLVVMARVSPVSALSVGRRLDRALINPRRRSGLPHGAGRPLNPPCASGPVALARARAPVPHFPGRPPLSSGPFCVASKCL